MIKKAILVAAAGLMLAVSAPSQAQGPFADVPIDHWAYDAVSQLQDLGIIIGYPDGTFSGRRALTRYEFAMALSRAIPVIVDMVEVPAQHSAGGGISEADVNKLIDDKIGKLDIPTLDTLNRSINEFRDELSGMGVDLDAVKRDLASIEERVAALEAENRRLKIAGQVTFFAIGESTKDAFAMDVDGRPLAPDNSLLKDIYFVRDADIMFHYTHPSGTKATVVLNAGSYLSYLGALTEYSLLPRTGLDFDDVSLFLAYGEASLFGADVTVGRFPIQFTKWTLSKVDVDTFSENWKTEDGKYYVDGIKGSWNWGGVDLLAFAGKNNSNNGLFNYGRFDISGLGRSAGQLQMPVQSAGVHAKVKLGEGNLGLTWLSVGEDSPNFYESANIYGVDLALPVGPLGLTAAYTVSDSKGSGVVGDLTNDNAAWEVALDGTFGALALNAGYRSIEPNFSAPGDWGLIGMWANPYNIEGPFVGVEVPLGRVALNAYGAWYEGIQNAYVNTNGTAGSYVNGWLNSGLKLEHYGGGISFATDAKGSIELSGEWVKWDPKIAGQGTPSETYYTFSYNRVITENTKMKLLYAIADYDADGSTISPYGSANYKANIAGAQISMGF